ncbi:hypothetical protein QCA50_003995 [Cerrena zonata]|uniref:F-box domain-containing protein n=1 Tax=Cerrena zonata TaxID=2478898 RepID=A0AAW0GGC2_9APHY
MINPSLPTELIIEILHFVDIQSLLMCRLACKDWNEIIQSDVSLVYKQELAVANMEDGNTDMSVVERLHLLREHQDAWEKHEFTDDTVINMHPLPHLAWDLQGGVLSQQTTLRSLTFYQIPSRLRGIRSRMWSMDDLDIPFADFGLDPSQDLLVLAESPKLDDDPYVDHVKSPSVLINHNSNIHKIHLRTLMNGVTHPLASNSILQYGSSYPHHHHNIRVFGDYLAVCWKHSLLVIWDWMSGRIQLVVTGSLVTFAFLPNNFLLIPRQQEEDIIAINLKLTQVEVDTPTSLSDIHYHCAFKLPPLASGYTIHHLEMRYDSQPSAKTVTVPFRTMHDGDRVILLDVGMINKGFAVAARFFLRGLGIIRHITAISPSPRSTARVHVLPWDIWGPQNFFPTRRNYCFIGTAVFPRNVHATNYVELEFQAAHSEGHRSVISVIDLNQMKCRKSSVGPDFQSVRGLQFQVHGFQFPIITFLKCKRQTLTLEREGREFYRAILISEDAIIVAYYSSENTTQFRVMSI